MLSDPMRFSDEIVRVYESCVDELLVNLARHFNVSAMGNIPTFDFEVELLAKMGAIRKETAQIIARHVSDNEPMIEEAVKTAMLDALKDVEPELAQAARAGLLEGTDVEMLDGIQDQLLAYSRQAVKQTNLVNTVMLDGTMEAYRKGIYAATDIVRQMKEAQTVLNAETGKVITGTSTLQEAVRSGVRAMHEAGITGFVDHGGHQWSAEAYVRMDVKTTCSNAANQAVMTRNEQYGNDLIWVNTNATARPGCYPWQGKVISMANRARVVTDGDGRKVQSYAVSQTTYGQPDGIYGINCHHGPMNVFIPGMSYVRGLEAAPSKDASDQIYQLTQKQRRMEREVRYAKREAAMLDAAGDQEGFERAALQVKSRTARLKRFVDENGLIYRSDRLYVGGYGNTQAGKVASAGRKKLAKDEKNGIVKAENNDAKTSKSAGGRIKHAVSKDTQPTKPNVGISESKFGNSAAKAGKLDEVLSPEMAFEYNAKMQGAPESVQKIHEKYRDRIYYADAESSAHSHYSVTEGGITTDLPKAFETRNGYTVYHEIGHNIDNNMHIDFTFTGNGKYGSELQYGYSYAYKKNKFGQALSSDAEKALEDHRLFMEKRHADIEAAVRSGYDPSPLRNFLETMGYDDSEIKEEIEDAVATLIRKKKMEAGLLEKPPMTRKEIEESFAQHIKDTVPRSGRMDISDMFEPVFKYIDYPFDAGHSRAYWTQGEFLQSTEAFAEMYSASVCNPESWEQIKKYFPDAVEVFFEMIGGVV